MKTLPLLLLMVLACPFQAAHARSAKKPKTIQGSGCVEKAPENSCRMVIDSQTGNIYDLLFAAKTPKAGTAIKFSGTPHKGGTACKQGKAVAVKKWTKEEGIKCPPPALLASNR